MIMRLLLLAALILGPSRLAADVQVTKIDFLEEIGVSVNAAGPLFVQMDHARRRLIVANTLTSSISIVDCTTRAVTNIALGSRALQHLKSESMTIRRTNGDIYLLGTNCLHIVFPGEGTARTITTGTQFESVAVDEATGNAYIAGRENPRLGSWKRGGKNIKLIDWLDHSEPLINLNMTPPPPIRKVIADESLGQIIAVDGFTSTLYLYDPVKREQISSRPLPLASGGRWHLAGYDERDHRLYIVTETADRKVSEAASIDVMSGDDVVVELPQYTEGVGIIYNPSRREVYIPYDNHASVHVVTFDGGGSLDEIAIPAYGNDASAIDEGKNILYVASWAFGEVDVIDLEARKLIKRITGLGIIPHMFTMAYDPSKGLLYFPKGATAVNGTFGAAVTILDPNRERTEKIRTGWAPIDLIEVPERRGFFVFNSEDRFADVRADGSYKTYDLPFDYPIRAMASPEGDVYLSYGPHQSYWPTVYIWDAKNGILTIDAKDLSFYDRRIPRQAHDMALDRDGACYFTQNNWGKEEQFIGVLEDQIRVFEPGKRLRLTDEVEREITQRILRYDEALHRLYLVRIGERDDEPSILQVVDLSSGEVLARVPVGLTATDLLFDDESIYVSNFDSKNVSIVDKRDFTVTESETGRGPFKLCRIGDSIFVINHVDRSVQEIGGKTYELPQKATPDNIFPWGEDLVVTAHASNTLLIIGFDPEKGGFELLREEVYPYGDVSFDTNNVSFYVRGQYGDALFEITRGETDSDGRLWITDFLSGKLFILTRD
jgi:DNA-binding beta-propeller fold protein YncE